MDLQETRYVTVGDSQVAFQVVGQGDQDLVFCASLGAQIDYFWQIPLGGEFLSRFIPTHRVIVFDRRGSGASDPVTSTSLPTWEEMTEDLTAVLDAVGSQRTAVIAGIDTGPIGLLFTAMHPERVSHLVLLNTTARFLESDDYPVGVSPEAFDSLVDLIAGSWGTADFARVVSPSVAGDADAVAVLARMMRASATPRTAAALWRFFMRSVDVRRFLPMVQAPTLVYHAVDNPFIPLSHGRFLAEHIPESTLVEMPGADMVPSTVNAAESAVDVIEFLTGERPVDFDRVLTTILFTDIVASTERAATMGDQRWRAQLDNHDRAVREQIRRFRGREVKTTGDGFLVSFDGPARAIRCAQAIDQTASGLGVDVRMGLHTGECEVRGDDLGGLAVHIAARVGAMAAAREILVSSTLKDLVVGSGIEFTDRGEHELKGVPDSWKVYAVSG